ncbi:hypothetical protein AK812_SmicGene39813 [Symbiodinium microadriaticum]|uniref:Uncharacterized protein n=1 Tax=Symbiodinium microadriaticum TaxID=2951 RepID=A0A1Q9CA99_SYMMI|nr:hypothetical protein AK812_SmicGene39813 [Symbiodinium microadriaticum]
MWAENALFFHRSLRRAGSELGAMVPADPAFVLEPAQSTGLVDKADFMSCAVPAAKGGAPKGGDDDLGDDDGIRCECADTARRRWRGDAAARRRRRGDYNVGVDDAGTAARRRRRGDDEAGTMQTRQHGTTARPILTLILLRSSLRSSLRHGGTETTARRRRGGHDADTTARDDGSDRRLGFTVG